MNDPNDSKNAQKFQVPNDRIMSFKAGYVKTSQVAEIIGVYKTTVEYWRKKGWFNPDFVDHNGVFYYSIESVMQLKEVYHANWSRGVYQPAPTVEPVIVAAKESRIADSNQDQEFLSNEIRNGTEPRIAMQKLCGSLRPSRVRVDINDKLAKVIFKLSGEGIGYLLEGDTFRIIEKRNHKKYGEIKTAYKILNDAGYQVTRPFTMLDRFVLSVCISEWLVGNRYTTVSVIYRGLTGKVGKNDSKPSVTQRKAIIESLEVLMSRIVDCDAEEMCRTMGYNNGEPFFRKGTLLPATYLDFSALDSDTLIFFEAEPPLLGMSQIKKQMVSYDATLLDMPGQNTPMNIEAKNYTMLRIQEIKLHKQLTPTITFADVFKKLRTENAHLEVKRRVREYVVAFFGHLKREGVIKSFEVVKHGNTFYGIKFPRTQKS